MIARPGSTASRGTRDICQPIDLGVAVEHHPADPRIDGELQFVHRFVVAVQRDRGRGNAGAEHDREFAGTADVDAEALFGDDLGDRSAEECLTRIEDIGIGEGIGVLPGALAQVVGIQDEDRRAVLGGEIRHQHSTECEFAVAANRVRRPDLRIQPADVLRCATVACGRQHISMPRTGRVGGAAHVTSAPEPKHPAAQGHSPAPFGLPRSTRTGCDWYRSVPRHPSV
jgi:hypothetical protein